MSGGRAVKALHQGSTGAFENGRNGRAPAEKRSEISGFSGQICCKSGRWCMSALQISLFCPDSPALPFKSSRISALFEARIRDSGRNVDPCTAWSGTRTFAATFLSAAEV